MTWYNHSYKGEIFSKYIVVVQSLSRVRLIATPWTATCQVSVLHPLPELTQTHVHWVSYAIQPSRPLLSRSLPAFSLSQHQGLFQWVGSLHQVARVEGWSFNLQHQSFQWIQDLFPLGLTALISFSITTVLKHQFFSAQHSLWSNS